MAEDDDWSTPAATVGRLKKTAAKESQRLQIAKLFDIPFSPQRGTELPERVSPRVFFTPAHRRPRAPTARFVPKSPVGNNHGQRITSTDKKGKFCTLAHVLKRDHAKQRSLAGQIRNLDVVLSVCVEDIDFRKRPGYRASDYGDVSNKTFLLDAKNILKMFVLRLKRLSSLGFNTAPYLDNLHAYRQAFYGAITSFLPAAAEREALIDEIENYGREEGDDAVFRDLSVFTPVKIRAFEDDDDDA